LEYVAFVQRDGSGTYHATLPDFPGCEALAGSWLQVEDAIREAVRLHIAGLSDVPAPTPIDVITEANLPHEACCMMVRLFTHEATPHLLSLPGGLASTATNGA
jgi:predicted RNase H-like HicB family nuclease